MEGAASRDATKDPSSTRREVQRQSRCDCTEMPGGWGESPEQSQDQVSQQKGAQEVFPLDGVSSWPQGCAC